MILTFNPQFIEPIKAGTKIHTIRTDKKARWKTGMKIHFWKGNPRNVKSKPYQFESGICTRIKPVTIDFQNNIVYYGTGKIKISTIDSLDYFAFEDGFENWDQLKKWFENEYQGITEFKGKLIFFNLDEYI